MRSDFSLNQEYIASVLFLLFFWCPCMAINVSVQYNGTVDPMLFPPGDPFKCHGEVLYLQPLIQPRRLDIFFPLRRSRRVLIFL